MRFRWILILLLGVPVSLSATVDMIGLYQALPIEYLVCRGVQHRYPLKQNGNKWFTSSLADYEMEVLVDPENGYLEIVDKGTGGGFITHELAVFRSTKRPEVIALNLYGGDGTMAESAGLRFLVRRGATWEEITELVLPEIGWRMYFQPNQWNLSDLEAGARLAAREKIDLIRYKLPRVGTGLRASFLRENLIIRGQYAPQGLEPDEPRLLLALVNTLARSRIVLNWDLEDGVFRLPD